MTDWLQHLEQLEKAATERPWEYHQVPLELSDLGRERIPAGSIPVNEHWLTTRWKHPQLKAEFPIVTISSGPYHIPNHSLKMRPEDGEFLASLRNAAPRLLAIAKAARELADEVITQRFLLSLEPEEKKTWDELRAALYAGDDHV